MKLLIPVLLAALVLPGCASKATTPPPTQELNAFGSHYTQRGSLEIATRAATKFCKHWNAVPAILTKQTKYNGKLLDEKSQTAVTAVTEAANAAGAFIPQVGGDAYETAITYKCL